MSRMISRPGSRLLLFLLVIGNAGPLLSQVITERPPPDYRSPTVVAAVASLKAWSDQSGISLTWPPASGATDYRVTRVDNTGSPEATIYQGPWTNFVFEAHDCSLTLTFRSCIFLDKNVAGGKLWSYRVWTGGGPSPVASVNLPFVALSNFKFTSSLYEVPGKLRLTFTWSAVPYALGYYVVFAPQNARSIPIPPKTVNKTSLVVDGVDPHTRYNVCVTTVYMDNTRDDKSRNCITVKL